AMSRPSLQETERYWRSFSFPQSGSACFFPFLHAFYPIYLSGNGKIESGRKYNGFGRFISGADCLEGRKELAFLHRRFIVDKQNQSLPQGFIRKTPQKEG